MSGRYQQSPTLELNAPRGRAAGTTFRCQHTRKLLSPLLSLSLLLSIGTFQTGEHLHVFKIRTVYKSWHRTKMPTAKIFPTRWRDGIHVKM